MNKHKKELQRYFTKWILLILIICTVISGIVGAFIGIKDSHLLLMILGELVVLTSVFFGFHMKTNVTEDSQSVESVK